VAIPPKVSSKAPPKIQAGRGKTVLVVDGDREHRARLVRLLRDATNRKPGEPGSPPAIHEADDGHAAWALIEVTKPDLIVTEILIEGLSGLQLLRRVREQFNGNERPPSVFFVTDMSNEVDRYWALRNGAAAYVIKPYDDEFLRQRVAKVLANEGAESAWPDDGE
jgi:twitching motility two-component system response regulator PilH